jgi:uncharacterized membrane protein YbhN (UPF0104 family)
VTIVSQRQRLTTGIMAVRATLARREVRLLTRVVAVAVVTLAALNARSLFGQLGAVGHPDPIWLGVALAAEIASMLAYALMVRELLRLGAVRASIQGLLRPMLGGSAMTASLPAGVGASNVYWYKQLRRHGADGRVAALVMTGTSVAGAISLFGLLALGVALAGDAGPLAQVHWWLLRIAALVLVLRFAFAHRLGRLLTTLLRRIAPNVENSHGVRVRRLRKIMAFAYANWLADCLALYASLMAVHATVPARSVILAYILAQLVAQVAVLPGGGGTVELSLATGFAAFGGHHGTVLAGVLLYRFLAYWALIPIGWLAVLFDPVRVKNAASADATSSSRVDPSPLLGDRRANDSVHRIGTIVRSHLARQVGEGRAGAQPELGARSRLPPAARPANRSEAGVASPSISPPSVPRVADPMSLDVAEYRGAGKARPMNCSPELNTANRRQALIFLRRWDARQ